MSESLTSNPVDLDRVGRTLARATMYASKAFPDGILEPEPERASAYNLIVYDAPELLIEIRRLRAEVDAGLGAATRLRAMLDEIRALHTDSVAGPCPTCYRQAEASDTDDGLVDWPARRCARWASSRRTRSARGAASQRNTRTSTARAGACPASSTRRCTSTEGASAMTSRPIVGEQPMPTPSHRESVQKLVRADLVAREAVGVERYGTPLQPHNGRDALRDAYDEALDLACYIRQALEERTSTTVHTREQLVRLVGDAIDSYYRALGLPTLPRPYGAAEAVLADLATAGAIAPGGGRDDLEVVAEGGEPT